MLAAVLQQSPCGVCPDSHPVFIKLNESRVGSDRSGSDIDLVGQGSLLGAAADPTCPPFEESSVKKAMSCGAKFHHVSNIDEILC
mmetsp:Transcript_35068/g.76871  ORF Transcript_35068/g.76871 Transcript_35068/m.76871 type:complete len:85 (+) Transcript_35068:22-276(+)